MQFKLHRLGLIKETKFYDFEITLKWHITEKKRPSIMMAWGTV